MSKRAIYLLGTAAVFVLVFTMPIQPVAAGIADWFYDDDGIVNPSASNQRYRRSEYDSDAPFFQWWYFTIKDLANNRYWAFDYSISDCADDLTNEGTYLMFSSVDKVTNTKFHKYERFSLSAFQPSNYFDSQVNCNGNVDYKLQVVNDNTYKVYGKMDNYANVWFADGCASNLFIEWNLTIYRIYGWYGQQDCESSLKDYGVISWDTYAHDAEVEGTITVGSTVYTISRNVNYRAYCDENWGENFPAGDPAIEYPWGWYYAGKPATSTANDVSIIAGVGRHDAGGIMGTAEGSYADIRLNSATHIGMRQNVIWDGALSAMESSNDGDVEQFTVTRDQWATYTDAVGSAQIPMHQKVTLETKHYLTTMDFYSEASDYNRLLFPHEDYVFSDFEGLGVDCHVVVKYHSITYKWYDIFHLNPIHTYTTLYDFWTDDAGLEYGYNVNG